MSLITTLHITAQSKVHTALLDVTLTSAEVFQFNPTPKTNNEDDETVKHDNKKKKKQFWQ